MQIFGDVLFFHATYNVKTEEEKEKKKEKTHLFTWLMSLCRRTLQAGADLGKLLIQCHERCYSTELAQALHSVENNDCYATDSPRQSILRLLQNERQTLGCKREQFSGMQINTLGRQTF